MAAGFDSDYSFMAVEIAGRKMSFQAVSRAGDVVDSGTIELGSTPPEKPPASAGSPEPGPAGAGKAVPHPR